ncbi:amidase [Deinococcus aetherius]|uniref:Amidase n=1 Tax=Deinococcus aetherius TaxID=200252 RepID=A0ABM8AG13_9DEIO|nr:amidase [Deinococcus aetherius]BDP42600.1 amidase [Deinococcus aetherius]
MNVEELTVQEVLGAHAAGTSSCETLTRMYLERIARFNPRYNALVYVNEHAAREARAVDTRLAAGEGVGVLAGIPVVIKDPVDVAGMPTTAGWAPLSERAGGIPLVPRRDAPVVARLRAAGAVILGKTNVPAFSFDLSRTTTSWAGPTLNAVQPELVPGASSAGSATAVSGNLALLGMGSETSGSIQNPAGAQALVGVKPTFGLVPTAGVVPLSASARDVLGPLARTVRDAAVMLDVMAGPCDEDPVTQAASGHLPREGYAAALRVGALRGKRLGLYGPGWRDQPLGEETRRLYERAIQDLRDLGAVPVEDPFAGSGFAAFMKGVRASWGFECLVHDLQAYLERVANASVPGVAALRRLGGQDPFAEGQVLSELRPRLGSALEDPSVLPDLSRFWHARERLLHEFDLVLATSALDALVFPQRVGDLPRLDGVGDIASSTEPEINIAGLPGVTVPAGYHVSGAPFALMFVGPMWSEADLLAFAYDYEQATRHRRAPVLQTR